MEGTGMGTGLEYMLWVDGRRFVCGYCGASVLARIGDIYRCNGCGERYEGIMHETEWDEGRERDMGDRHYYEGTEPPPGSVAADTPLMGAVGALLNAQDALDKQLAELTARLGPVLSGLAKQRGEAVNSYPTAVSSPLGNKIATAENRTRGQIARIAELLEELEV